MRTNLPCLRRGKYRLPAASGYRAQKFWVRSFGNVYQTLPKEVSRVRYEHPETGKSIPSISRFLESRVGGLQQVPLARNGIGPRPIPAPVTRKLLVPLREGKDLVLTRENRNILYSLKPWEYLNASSDTTYPLQVRALIKSSKPLFLYAHRVKENAISSLREGDKIAKFLGDFRVVVDSIRSERFDLQSTIELRYIKFCIAEIRNASRFLSEVVRISSFDLKNPLLRSGDFLTLRSLR